MNALFKSPLTTIGGILAAAGSAMVGIPMAIAAINASSESINFALPHGTVWLVIVGSILAPVGTVLIGSAARDSGTTSRDAGAE